jgi:Basic region leucine zipper
MESNVCHLPNLALRGVVPVRAVDAQQPCIDKAMSFADIAIPIIFPGEDLAPCSTSAPNMRENHPVTSPLSPSVYPSGAEDDPVNHREVSWFDIDFHLSSEVPIALLPVQTSMMLLQQDNGVPPGQSSTAIPDGCTKQGTAPANDHLFPARIADFRPGVLPTGVVSKEIRSRDIPLPSQTPSPQNPAFLPALPPQKFTSNVVGLGGFGNTDHLPQQHDSSLAEVVQSGDKPRTRFVDNEEHGFENHCQLSSFLSPSNQACPTSHNTCEEQLHSRHCTEVSSVAKQSQHYPPAKRQQLQLHDPDRFGPAEWQQRDLSMRLDMQCAPATSPCALSDAIALQMQLVNEITESQSLSLEISKSNRHPQLPIAAPPFVRCDLDSKPNAFSLPQQQDVLPLAPNDNNFPWPPESESKAVQWIDNSVVGPVASFAAIGEIPMRRDGNASGNNELLDATDLQGSQVPSLWMPLLPQRYQEKDGNGSMPRRKRKAPEPSSAFVPLPIPVALNSFDALGERQGEDQTATRIKEERARRNRESARRSRLKSKLLRQDMVDTQDRLLEENNALKCLVDGIIETSKDIPFHARDTLLALLSPVLPM